MRRSAQPGEWAVQPAWLKGVPTVSADLDRVHGEQWSGIGNIVAEGAPGDEQRHFEPMVLSDSGILDRQRGLALDRVPAIGRRDVVMDVAGEDYDHSQADLGGGAARDPR